MRRALLMLFALLFVLAIAPAASADKPTKTSFEGTAIQTVTGICDFPLDVTSFFRATEIDFVDQSGELVRSDIHVVEQDTFSANGRSLTGDPFTFNIYVSKEDGEVTADLAHGVGEKVRLANGELFISAGVIDFLAQDVPFSIRTDHGVTGDIDALCAPLSP